MASNQQPPFGGGQGSFHPQGASSYPERSGPPTPPFDPPVPAPPSRTPRKRSVLATLIVAAVGIVVVPFALLLLVGVVFAMTSRPAPVRAPASAPATSPVAAPQDGAITEAGTLSAIDLQPGDCYNNKQPPMQPGQVGKISTVEAVPCTAPHTNQVTTKIAYSVQDPLSEVQATRAGKDCESDVVRKLQRSALKDRSIKFGAIYPADEFTWQRKPIVVCYVRSDRPITRSLIK